MRELLCGSIYIFKVVIQWQGLEYIRKDSKTRTDRDTKVIIKASVLGYGTDTNIIYATRNNLK
jgi:hypothetical protein